MPIKGLNGTVDGKSQLAKETWSTSRPEVPGHALAELAIRHGAETGLQIVLHVRHPRGGRDNGGHRRVRHDELEEELSPALAPELVGVARELAVAHLREQGAFLERTI